MGLHVYTTVTAKRQRAAHQALLDGVFDYDTATATVARPPCCGKPVKRPGTTSRSWPIWPSSRPISPDGRRGHQLGDKSATLVLKNGKQAELGWNGIKWARLHHRRRRGFCPEIGAGCTESRRPDSGSGEREELLLSQIPDVNAALVAMNPQDGAIEALVGGFSLSSPNSTGSIRPAVRSAPTSKPFLYATALEQGYTLASSSTMHRSTRDPAKGPMWAAQELARHL